MINNSVNPINSPNTVVITGQNQTNVSVTQPVTTVLEVGAVGPQGQKGDTGPQGPQGDPGPQGPPGTLEAFEGIIVTGSSIFSGSTEFTTLPTIQVTGSFEVLGTASLNGYGLLTTAFTSSYNTFTASYYTDSSSFNTRVTNLEAFSSSLDATFATDAQLNAATASLSASISSLSASYLASSASFDTRITNNSSSIASFSGSYLVDSASFNTRILSNSSSISSLSSSFVSFSGSYNTGSFTGSFSGNGAGLTNIPASGIVGLNLSQIASGSATASISPTDGFRVNTNSTITGSLLVTNGISGSFSGSGANLFDIPASGIVGLNLSQIASGSATASISPTAGFRVNTNTTITGSLIVSGSSTLTNIGPAIFSGSLIVTEGITGSLLGTASYAVNALTASYAMNVPLTASYATSASQAISSSYAFSASYAVSASQATSASYALSSSYATNASYSVLADTASFLPSTTNLNISSITASSAYFQSASIGFLQTITGSATVIGDAFIILNTATPASRYAGIIVEDSGSNPVDYTASFFFDSVTNDWNYEYSSSTVPNYGVALFGPEYLTKGSPSYPAANVLQKGNGGHHLLDSSITDDGTTVTISASVVITGSLQATGGISGSFSGSGANLFNIPASGITGLNLSQIATGSVTASVSTGTRSFSIVSGSSNFLFVSSSGNVGIGTSTPNSKLDVSGSGRFSGNLTITGSATNSLLVKGSGTTSATNTFVLQNSAATNLLTVRDDNAYFFGASTSNRPVFYTNTSNPVVAGSLFTFNGSSGNGDFQNVSLFKILQPAFGSNNNSYYNALDVDVSIIGRGRTNAPHRMVYIHPTFDTSSGALNETSGIEIIYPRASVLDTLIKVSNSLADVFLLRGDGKLTISGSITASGSLAQSTYLNQTLIASASNDVLVGLDINPTFNTGSFTGVNRYALRTNGDALITGSLTVTNGITGSFSGSGTIASASYALTASYVNPLTQSVFISSSNATQLQVGSNLLFVSSSGNVGVGTNNPTQKLHINSSGPSTRVLIDNTNVDGLYTPNSGFGLAKNGVLNWSIAAYSTNFNFTFYNDFLNADALFITRATNNIGIGTTTDSGFKLDVSGSGRFSSNLTITGSATNSLLVKGSGTTSATNALLIQNSSGNSSLAVLDNGYVGIGTTTPSYKLQVVDTSTLNPVFEAINNGSGTYIPVFEVNAPNLTSGQAGYFAIGRNRANNNQFSFGFEYQSNGSENNKFNINAFGTPALLTVLAGGNVGIGATTPSFKLDVSGSGRFTNNLIVTGSFTVITGSTIEFQVNQTGVKIGNATTDSHQITGSVAISSSFSTSSAALLVYKSGSTVMDIQGSTGQLFSITDSLTGSLFSVNTVAGLPVIEAFSDNTVNIGKFGVYPIKVAATGTLAVITGSFTGSLAGVSATASYVNPLTQSVLISGSIALRGNQSITGSLFITASAGTGSALTVYKSGSTVVSIQGSQGELFSITDSLSGSLFSVSNISGLPILEVFSDNTTLIGNYLDPMLVTTQLVTANSGSTTIYSLPTASYDGAFYDYVVRSGSNSRAGQIMAIWSGSSVNYTDNSTTDFGSTANLSFNVIVSGSNMVLRSTVTTGSWTVKTIIRSI